MTFHGSSLSWSIWVADLRVVTLVEEVLVVHGRKACQGLACDVTRCRTRSVACSPPRGDCEHCEVLMAIDV